MGPVLAAGLSVLNEDPVVVLQATSWVQVLVINRDTQHGVPRPEGLCDPIKILTIRVTRENKKVHAKTNQYKGYFLNIQNNSHFPDKKK